MMAQTMVVMKNRSIRLMPMAVVILGRRRCPNRTSERAIHVVPRNAMKMCQRWGV